MSERPDAGGRQRAITQPGLVENPYERGGNRALRS